MSAGSGAQRGARLDGRLNPRQLWVLVALTLVWGLNWPVMKAGVSGLPDAPSAFPPLSFRALSMLLGLPVLGAALVLLNLPFTMPRRHWRELAMLTLVNMLVWHVVVIVSVQQLSSGRSAILGYTMPVFAALIGRWVFGDRLPLGAWLGVAAAGAGVLLLLSSELGAFGGAPLAVTALVGAAAVWAYGTHRLRRSPIDVPLLAVVFWMTAITAFVMSLAAYALEGAQWRAPEPLVWGSVLYNAVGVFGFAHAAWFYLARTLPPLASSISVMLIPVLGVVSGAVLLGEQVHGTDWAAMVLIVIAIALVLLRRQSR